MQEGKEESRASASDTQRGDGTGTKDELPKKKAPRKATTARPAMATWRAGQKTLKPNDDFYNSDDFSSDESSADDDNDE